MSLIPLPGYAITCQVDMNQNSITFSPQIVLENRSTRVYAILTSTCAEDMEGTLRFYDQGALINGKSFSIRANGRPEEVWTTWLPKNVGDHEIAVEVTADVDSPATFPNRRVTLPVAVERDTDGDGITDRLDSDMDNDGISNEDEVRAGTDPLRLDTDGDGADDKSDAFPLDPNRRSLPKPPPPPVTPPTTTSSTTQKTTTPTPSTKTVATKTTSVKPASTAVTPAPAPTDAPRPTMIADAQVTLETATTLSLTASSTASTSSTPSETIEGSTTTAAIERWTVPTSTHVQAIEPSLPPEDPRNPLTMQILAGVAVITALSGIAFFILSARA